MGDHKTWHDSEWKRKLDSSFEVSTERFHTFKKYCYWKALNGIAIKNGEKFQLQLRFFLLRNIKQSSKSVTNKVLEHLLFDATPSQNANVFNTYI